MSTLLRAPPHGKALLTVTETALALGVHTCTIHTWLERGRFPGAIRTPGGRWRVPAAGVARVRVELGIDGGGS